MKKIVSFGELLIRLSSPGYQRLSQANQLSIDFGGAEANVAVSLAQFGDTVSYVTRVPDNDMVESALRHLKGFGIDTSDVLYGGDRIGLYYYENGAIGRSSKVVYDRNYSSMVTLEKGMIDWEGVIEGADWFHWSGITPAISESATLALKEGLEIATRKGLTISMDYNFRGNLWKWGKSAEEVMPELMKFNHVMSGTHPDVDVLAGDIDDSLFEEEGQKIIKDNPNCKIVVFTSRGTVSASHNTWSGALYDGKNVYRSQQYDLTHIVDRVGGGDSFMAALIYGLRNLNSHQETIEFAVAASAIKHTIEGDQNICSKQEVLDFIKSNGSGKIIR
ncbi:sugar kinase [Flammeovirga kamogawensis]|uniref:Sugar kinase n=1 Tax=Flammeovirga kamogawensis TaxID=373891 RepID=A0ABX8H2M9_9BACT|nr:sugar kinase [Flammeovirga kamogawensis]MBB6460359.1 2-dehydro-3-deoxygluconokinase [Flammeovirga kamogawensis]QWG10168.1 sugar kinase [Flammeovirga kamogawensis]TRX64620.1 sugar kinase [Flammeovirga kamogawensis]